MAFDILLTDLAKGNLKELRAYDRRIILDEIDKQLKDQPTVATRNRKKLETVVPPFEHDPPIWELRVGEYRVFYDVQDSEGTVTIRTVRRKTPDQTTEDLLHERDDA
jgi:mRNA-degrading endonuclease RelE of RelBE toxin-antitoxin system